MYQSNIVNSQIITICSQYFKKVHTFQKKIAINERNLFLFIQQDEKSVPILLPINN